MLVGLHEVYSLTASRPLQKWLDYGLDDREIEVRFLAGGRDLFLPHNVYTKSVTFLPSWPMGTGVISLGSRSVKLTANLHLIQKVKKHG
jgi:hypothetical protein